MSLKLAVTLAVVLVLVLAGLVIALFLRTVQAEYEGVGSLTVYCIDIKFNPPIGYAVADKSADCTEWTNTVMKAQRSAVLDCYRPNVNYPELFKQCLVVANIIPPGVIRQ